MLLSNTRHIIRFSKLICKTFAVAFAVDELERRQGRSRQESAIELDEKNW